MVAIEANLVSYRTLRLSFSPWDMNYYNVSEKYLRKDYDADFQKGLRFNNDLIFEISNSKKDPGNRNFEFKVVSKSDRNQTLINTASCSFQAMTHYL